MAQERHTDGEQRAGEKMANGLEGLQDSITGLGRDLKTALSDMVSAHDTEDGERFEDAAGQADDLISQLQSLGKADNQATKAGQSPSPAVNLKQNAGPVSEGTGEGGSDDFH